MTEEVKICEDDNVLIRTKNLTKNYGNKKVLDDVDLEIKKGAIYGFIGKNGSGKTTTMRLILGLCKPSRGSVEICKNIKRSDISAVIEYPSFFPNMDAVTNMISQCMVLGVKNPKKVSQELLSLMGLDPKDRSKVKNYSLGMKQRLAIAMALICKGDSNVPNVSDTPKVEGKSEETKTENTKETSNTEMSSESTSDGSMNSKEKSKAADTSAKETNNVQLGSSSNSVSLPDLSYPSVLLLDEPINGLDPEGIREIREIILRLNKEKGVTFLISSHILSELEKIATHFGVICNGKLSAQFEAKDLKKKVQGCVRLKTNNNSKAVEVLVSELSISNYRVEDGEILIFDDNMSTSSITKKLIEHDLIIESINSETGNYEDYFIKLMGGN